MKIGFDPVKSARNTELRGLPFDLVTQFDFDTARIIVDNRHEYGELRYRAIGRLKNDTAVVVFTMRGDIVRVISLRLASRKERREYEEAQGQTDID